MYSVQSWVAKDKEKTARMKVVNHLLELQTCTMVGAKSQHFGEKKSVLLGCKLLGFGSLNGVFLFSAAFACMEPLGMESWEITSEQISASSQYNPSWSPERSRLNYPENGWTPSDDTVREWIQVSGSSPAASSLVNNGTMPHTFSSPSLSSAFGVCLEVSARRSGVSRHCSHLAWIFFDSFVRLPSTSRGPKISQHSILTSHFSLNSLFSFFFLFSS